MAKNPVTSTVKVRDAKTGKVFVLRGMGALKSNPLPIDPEIDLTRPIAAQALADKRALKG